MKINKYLLFIIIIIGIYAALLVNAFGQQSVEQGYTENSMLSEQENDDSFMADLEDEEIPEAEESTRTEENGLTEPESISAAGATPEAEEATETIAEAEVLTATVTKPTTTVSPEKESVSEGIATQTPEQEATQKPVTTPEPEPVQKPTITPGLESTQKPTTAPESPKQELVQQGYYDINIIPDKFNTGCSNVENMLKINDAVTVDGIQYALGDNGGTVVLDLFYRNKDIPNEIVIKNIDFSEKKFAVRHGSKIDRTMKITFENCKFGFAVTEIDQNNVTYFFESCSFSNFNGSNSTFTKCSFGGTVYDGMNPFKNIYVIDSYFSDFNAENTVGVHSDAIQIYGKEGIDAENITFQNCRIEIPIIKDSISQINSCFMVQLEYSNAKNFLFENCIINGGGYSIYARHVKGVFTLENVVFRNISIGGAKLYGNVYPGPDGTVVFDGLKETESLYVASVWKDTSGKIHLSVTNDTTQDRYLVVETQNDRQEFLIPSKQTMETSGKASFSDLPIDMEIILDDANATWVICYDKIDVEEKQIRFVNWGSNPVYR